MTRLGIFLTGVALLIAPALIAGTAPSGQISASVSYVLSISSTAGGTVATPGLGSFAYYEGTVITLMATPRAGYHFVNWTGNVTTLSSTKKAATSITMKGDYSIMANFEIDPPVQYMLAILSAPGGSVVTPGHGTFTYDAGTVVNLQVAPASGYEFLKWSGNVDTVADVNATSTSITMSGDDTYILICANFRESPAPCGGVRY